MEKLNGADYLLLLFYLPGVTNKYREPITGRTRITKMMFLFREEIFKKLELGDLTLESDLPNFEAYHYGPFSKDVHEQLALFTNIGFLEETLILINNRDESDLDEDITGLNEDEEEINSDYISQYKLTDVGAQYVEKKIIQCLDQKQIDFLIEFKKRINSITLNTLLSYVYNKYPKYAEKSRIRNKVK